MAGPAKQSGEKLIASNPKARANYFIEEVVEAGLVLTGTEIKSIRAQAPNIRDAFVEVYSHGRGGMEAWLVNMHISPYSHGNIWNHIPERKRKLLLHRHQINQIFAAIQQKGVTVIPLRLYLKSGRAKIEIALAKGKKLHDKRETLKRKTAEREMEMDSKRR